MKRRTQPRVLVHTTPGAPPLSKASPYRDFRPPHRALISALREASKLADPSRLRSVARSSVPSAHYGHAWILRSVLASYSLSFEVEANSVPPMLGSIFLSRRAFQRQTTRNYSLRTRLRAINSSRVSSFARNEIVPIWQERANLARNEDEHDRSITRAIAEARMSVFDALRRSSALDACARRR